jgi:hypothetical protein
MITLNSGFDIGNVKADNAPVSILMTVFVETLHYKLASQSYFLNTHLRPRPVTQRSKNSAMLWSNG